MKRVMIVLTPSLSHESIQHDSNAWFYKNPINNDELSPSGQIVSSHAKECVGVKNLKKSIISRNLGVLLLNWGRRARSRILTGQLAKYDSRSS